MSGGSKHIGLLRLILVSMIKNQTNVTFRRTRREEQVISQPKSLNKPQHEVTNLEGQLKS